MRVFPTISIYEYTPDKTLSICNFKSMTDEWLDFIADCIYQSYLKRGM